MLTPVISHLSFTVALTFPFSLIASLLGFFSPLRAQMSYLPSIATLIALQALQAETSCMRPPLRGAGDE